MPHDIDYDFQKHIRIARVRRRDGSVLAIEYACQIDWARMIDGAQRAMTNKSKRAVAGPLVFQFVGSHTEVR